MPAANYALPLMMGIALMLTGCGIYVPEIQENPWSPDPNRLVEAIVGSIQCEIRNAVTYVINTDRRNYWDLGQPLQADWLFGWGAQIQVTLQINEQSSVSPSGLYFPMNIFFLGGGANLSSSATRIDTLAYYYLVRDIYGSGNGCPQNTTANLADHPIGSLLIQSDLKLKEWLLAVVLGHGTGAISITNTTNKTAKNAISHEVKFEVITSGNITPTWKLVHATINPNGPLFTASRDRTHDLLITFGPDAQGQLAPPAAGTNQASQIGIAVSNHTINSMVP